MPFPATPNHRVSVVSLKLINRGRHCASQLTSFFFSRFFKSVGLNFYLEWPRSLVGVDSVSVGDNFSCFKGLRLEVFSSFHGQQFTPFVRIGNNVSFNYFCHIACCNSVTIGDNVLLASNVFVTDHLHGKQTDIFQEIPPGDRLLYS